MPVRDNTPERAGLRSTHPVSRPHPCAERRESAGLFARSPVVHWRNGLAAGGNRIRTIGPAEKETAVGRGPAADHRRFTRRPVLNNDPSSLSVRHLRSSKPRDFFERAVPKVRIRFPPANSPFLAGFLSSVSKSRQLPRCARARSGGTAGRDAQAPQHHASCR